MMIERYAITTEEESTWSASKALAGTLLVAIVCLIILRIGPVGRFVVCFPEALLFVAGSLLAVGRYSGYRLTELYRFHDVIADSAAERE